MEQTKLLQQIAQDVGSMKQTIKKIEQDLEEISTDLHEVKPDYLEKLKKIDSGRFLSRKQFEEELGA